MNTQYKGMDTKRWTVQSHGYKHINNSKVLNKQINNTKVWIQMDQQYKGMSTNGSTKQRHECTGKTCSKVSQ